MMTMRWFQRYWIKASVCRIVVINVLLPSTDGDHPTLMVGWYDINFKQETKIRNKKYNFASKQLLKKQANWWNACCTMYVFIFLFFVGLLRFGSELMKSFYILPEFLRTFSYFMAFPCGDDLNEIKLIAIRLCCFFNIINQLFVFSLLVFSVHCSKRNRINRL